MENSSVNQEKKYLFVERKSPEILSLLSTAPVYKKSGLVRIRPAKIGESIDTILLDGTVETSNTVSTENNFIVTNPDGEKYVIPKEKLDQRYMPTDDPEVYEAAGYIRAIQNPYGKDIEILASWGKSQFGDSECFVADTCDSAGASLDGEPYIIDVDPFKNTYAPVIKS